MPPTKELIWSPYQKAIFRDIADPNAKNTIVVARAGSAKSSTIIQGSRYIPKGKRALFCAFNKSIQLHLKDKLPSYSPAVTLHSLGFQALKTRFPNAELNDNKCWEIVTDIIGDSKDNYDLREAICKTVGLCKARLVDIPTKIDELMAEFDIDLCEIEVEQFIKYVCQALRQCKERIKDVDFNDMVWFPFVYGIKPTQTDILFLDETQDLTRCQFELAMSAVKPGGRIIAVMDDRQVLYSWAGVDLNTLDYIRTRLHNPKELMLPVCYRCPSSVVKLAQKYVPDIQVWDKAIEGKIEYIHTDDLVSRVAPGSFILSRYNAPLVGIVFKLLKAGIRANIRGRDIGKNLSSLIKKSKKKTVPKLIEWLVKWEKQEKERILAKNPRAKTEYVKDKADCLYSLCENCSSIEEVQENIDKLFKDPKKKEDETAEDRKMVILSSVHKSKGDERDVVFLLSETLSDGDIAEENITYVAYTRAKKELYFCSKNNNQGFDAE